jgi:tetratricopeptide (TPR) repeat protein
MRHAFIVALLSTLVVEMTSHAGAFEPGDLVVVTQAAELRVPTGKVADVAPGDFLNVEQVKDKWLWVQPTDDGKPGWIAATKVVAYEQALDHFQERVEKSKQDATAFAGRAALLQGKFEWDKALEDYEVAMGLGLKSSKLHCTRGFLRIMRDKIDEGLADLNEALRLDPKNAEAMEYRAGLFAELSQFDKALADYRRLIELQPNDPSSLAALAELYAACPDAKYRDGNRAYNLAMKACQLSQWQEPGPISALAAAYAELKNFAKAVEFAQRAITVSQDPNQDELEKQLELYQANKPHRLEPEQKP